MERLLKHKVLIGLVTVAVAASAGVAYAATQSATTSRQALINDVAKRLNVSPAQLRAAVKGALLDRLQAAVKAGELTQAQANKIKQRIENGALPIGPLGFERRAFGPPGFGPPGFARPGFGPPGLGPMGYGPPGFPPRGTKRLFVPGPGHGPFAAAAKYLGISETQLLKDLRGGKSLAQVAKANGKSVSGLEQALTASLKTRLDRAVAAGFINKAQEQRMLQKLSAAMAGLANARGFQIQRVPIKPGLRPGPGPAAVPVPGPAGAAVPGPAVAPGPPGVPPPSA